MLGHTAGQRENKRAATLQTPSFRGSARPTAGPQAEAGRPGRTPAKRALGKHASNSSSAGQGGYGLDPVELAALADAEAKRQQRRWERASWRGKLREVTGLNRLRQCGVSTVSGTGGPVLRMSEGPPRIAGYAGLSTCGSVWVCPVCAAKIAARRAEELALLMRRVLHDGGSASMITLTMRHHPGQSLAQCWAAAAYAWSRVTSGQQWIADQAVGDMRGWVRALEVTHGRNGWHVHLHILTVWTNPVSLELAETVGHRMHARWQRALIRKGFDSWADSGGLDVRMATLDSDNLADYFVKLAREITAGGVSKEGRQGGRTPFAIARDMLTDHLAADGELWWEWEQASHGRKQLTWSQGLRKWAELGVEQTDEEIAEEELGGEDVLGLTAESWGYVVANKHTTDLLDVAENEGIEGACRWLDERDLAWQPVRAAPRMSGEPPRRSLAEDLWSRQQITRVFRHLRSQ